MGKVIKRLNFSHAFSSQKMYINLCNLEQKLHGNEVKIVKKTVNKMYVHLDKSANCASFVKERAL